MRGAGGSRDGARAAWLWDALLVFYGRRLPYHPLKWRVAEALFARTEPTWNVPRRVVRDRVAYELDLRQSMDRFLYFLEYERWETRALRRLVRPGWRALDVGANVGYYTLLLANLVGPTGNVWSFEPAADTFASLERNVGLNPKSSARIRLLRLALSDREGSASLVTGTHHGLARLGEAADAGAEPVSVTTLDRLLEHEGRPQVDLIKVDIEGAEGRLLDGAAATLERCRPWLMVELYPAGLALFGTSVEQVAGALRRRGYELLVPTWRGLRPFEDGRRIEHYVNVIARPAGPRA